MNKVGKKEIYGTHQGKVKITQELTHFVKDNEKATTTMKRSPKKILIRTSYKGYKINIYIYID
jgi:hypothetical protein